MASKQLERGSAGRFVKRRPPVGARPGTLVLPEGAQAPRIGLMRYSAEEVVEEADVAVAALPGLLEAPGTTWIDVQGLGDEGVLLELGRVFGIHPLALEDVVHSPQRPKVEFFDEHVFYITRMLRLEADGCVGSEQVSLFVGRGYVLTFQERYGDVLDPVRVRMRQGKGPMRRSGPDYLAYAILDAIIDGYYPVLERLGETLERMEDQVLADADEALLTRLNDIKREILHVRRCVWPQRDAINSLLRDDSPLVTDTVRVYLRDCYDHCIQLADVVETHRELAANLLNVYLTSVANRTNEVMKVLTIMASIFIPLTFMAGIYGMNFEHMPELGWRWSYGVFWGLTVVTGVSLLVYFRRKGWLGSR